jgi:hypothetical protein
MKLLIYILPFVYSQQSTATIGTPCDKSLGDENACQEPNFFLSCENNNWTLQNKCTGSCFSDSGYASSCFKLKPVIETTTTAPAPSKTSNTTEAVESDKGIPLWGIISMILAIICLCIFVYIYRQTSAAQELTDSTKKRPLSPVDVLNKRYICIRDYTPIASDEVQLVVGDIVVLDLLFNDGWAKGKNESNKITGVLPVSCIEEIR